MLPVNASINENLSAQLSNNTRSPLLESELSNVQLLNTTTPADAPATSHPYDKFSVLKNVPLYDTLLAEPISTAPTGGTSSSGGLSVFSDKIGALDDSLQGLMNEVEGLDPTNPADAKTMQFDMLKIQEIQQQIQELTSLMSNEMSAQHQAAMAIIGNMK